MFGGILRRAIFWELAKVFLLSLVGITGIIVLASIIVEASQRGLAPSQIVTAIPLLVPSMLPFIIPPTTLFATCVVYGRLAHDNEIIAIKAAGINVLHAVWPAVFLGLTMSLATLGLYYHLIPYTHHLLRTAVANDLQEFIYSMLKKDGQFRGRSGAGLKTNYEIYVQGVQGHLLKTAIFKRRIGTEGDYDLIARAREAELQVDIEKKEINVRMRDGQFLNADGKHRGYILENVYSVPFDLNEKAEASSRDMTWRELVTARREQAALIEQTTTVLADLIAQELMRQGPKDMPMHRKNWQLYQHGQYMRLYNLSTELHMRPALSFGCLFFVLVGCPVGIWFSRSDYLSAFITCFMPIVFVYYPIQLCCTNFAKDGKIHPAIALWAANAALGVMALFLFRRLLRN